MIPMKFGWLGLEMLCLFLFAYFASPEALSLGLVLLIAPLVGLGKNLLVRKKLQLHIDVVPSLRKGDPGAITLSVTNPTAFPVLRLRCPVQVENQLNGQRITRDLYCWAMPRRTGRWTLRLGSEYCGRIRVAVEKGKLYDCFGLVAVAVPWKEVVHTVVQPDTFPMEVSILAAVSRTEDSPLYSQERPGADLTETYQIREYVPGDSPRQIHWKLSQKLDRLIVRDPALPLEQNVLVFWERTGQSGDPERTDAQAEVVVSLCRALADAGVPFTIGWNDTDRNLCVLHDIRDMDTLVGVIPRLLRATGSQTGISGGALLMQTGRQALCAHIVYIAESFQGEIRELGRFGHVTALLCGESGEAGAIGFLPENYRQQLTQIEL